MFANSIVSSRLLAAQAAAAGVRHEETLTGFKWIARVPGLRYGYEEALGYCVDPASVQDKDGVTAALLLAEMAAGLGRRDARCSTCSTTSPVAHGVHATDALSVRVADLSLIGTVMQRLRSAPPAQIGGVEVRRVDDLAQGSAQLPPTDGLRYHLADDSRVIVRPSGTEPKLKVYLEVVVPVAGPGTLGKARTEGARPAGPGPGVDGGAHGPRPRPAPRLTRRRRPGPRGAAGREPTPAAAPTGS